MAVLVIYVSLLIYNRTMLDEPTVQLLFLFCLGAVVQACRYGKETEEAASAEPVEKPASRRVGKSAYMPLNAMRWRAHGK